MPHPVDMTRRKREMTCQSVFFELVPTATRLYDTVSKRYCIVHGTIRSPEKEFSLELGAEMLSILDAAMTVVRILQQQQ